MNKNTFYKKMANSIHLEDTINNTANNSINASLKDYQIKGNTINYYDNLFDFSYYSLADAAKNDISICTVDGALHVYGTPSAQTTFTSGERTSTATKFPKGTYKIICKGHLGLNFRTLANGTLKQVQKPYNVDTYTFTLEEDYYLRQYYIWFREGQVGIEYDYTTIPTITRNTNETEEIPYNSNPELTSTGDTAYNQFKKLYKSWVTAANNATVTFDEENQKINVVDGSSKWGCARLLTNPLIAGKTYTFSATLEELNSSTGARLYAQGTYFNDGNQKWSDYCKTVGNRMSLTFTVQKTTSRGSYLGLYPYGADKEGASATFSNISLVEGKPSDPYNIPIHVTGKNLLDLNQLSLAHPKNYYYTATRDVSDNYISIVPYDQNVINACYFHCAVPVGEKITISASKISLHSSASKPNSAIRYAFCDHPFEQFEGNLSNVTGLYAAWYGSQNSNNPPTSLKLTTTATKPYLLIVLTIAKGTAAGNLRIEDFQVELGNQQTVYRPFIGEQKTLHLKEPLRKLSDETLDYIDFRTQKIYRKVRKLVVTGDEAFSAVVPDTANEFYRFRISTNQLAPTGSVWENQLSNYYKGVAITTSNTDTGVSVYYSSSLGGTYFRIRDKENFSSVDELKAWLKERYNEGKPLTIYYNSYEAYEESIELPKLPQYKGITNYQIPTLVKSDFVGTYKTRL